IDPYRFDAARPHGRAKNRSGRCRSQKHLAAAVRGSSAAGHPCHVSPGRGRRGASAHGDVESHRKNRSDNLEITFRCYSLAAINASNRRRRPARYPPQRRWPLQRLGEIVSSDIGIAQSATLKPIGEIAARLGIPAASIESYAHYKAKSARDSIKTLKDSPDGKLILVTALSPTPAGEGKTTTTVGLGDALNHIGKQAMICLREPSLGPVFGMKGGAAGGGFAQVVPMEDINLHFTGDFSAIALANNLLAALLDNHIHHGNELGIDVRRIAWKRVVDMNDRALRD